MIISARFPAAAVAAALALSLMGGAANADYVANPIDISFGFAPTTGTTLTANTGILTPTTAFITATTITPTTITANALTLSYAVTSTSVSNIGNLPVGAPVTLLNPTPLLLGSPFTKTFTTSAGTALENLTVTLVTFTGSTAGASSLVTSGTSLPNSQLVIKATGTISFTGEETPGTGFVATPIAYTATYTQPFGGGPISATFTDVTVPGPIAGAGLPGLILAGGALLGWWRRRRKIA
jgi:hypothetical protein